MMSLRSAMVDVVDTQRIGPSGPVGSQANVRLGIFCDGTATCLSGSVPSANSRGPTSGGHDCDELPGLRARPQHLQSMAGSHPRQFLIPLRQSGRASAPWPCVLRPHDHVAEHWWPWRLRAEDGVDPPRADADTTRPCVFLDWRIDLPGSPASSRRRVAITEETARSC